MLEDIVLTACLAVGLGCFFVVNLSNILKFHRVRIGGKSDLQIEEPSGIAVTVAGIGTLVYFIEATSFPPLILADLLPVTRTFFLFDQPFNLIYARIFGLALTLIGYSLFIWSVIIRGKYAVSWQMPENHKLITHGPYKHVRHPSYLAYMLMFLGLPLLWPNLLTLIPLAAIPGYVKVTAQEEKLLATRFGNEYEQYRQKTGRFVPQIRSKQHVPGEREPDGDQD